MTPFESEKQRRYLFAKKPSVAKEFAAMEKGGNVSASVKTKLDALQSRRKKKQGGK